MKLKIPGCLVLSMVQSYRYSTCKYTCLPIVLDHSYIFSRLRCTMIRPMMMSPPELLVRNLNGKRICLYPVIPLYAGAGLCGQLWLEVASKASRQVSWKELAQHHHPQRGRKHQHSPAHQSSVFAQLILLAEEGLATQYNRKP